MKRAMLALACALAATVAFAAEEVLTIPSRSGVTLSYLLVRDPSATPRLVVIAFVGDYGAIDLLTNDPSRFGPTANFLVRTRHQLADADIADAIVDSPSDRLPQGMTDAFRLGPEHVADIRALIADLKQRFPNAQVELLGNSRGTVSAAALAAKLGDWVHGVVLTSTATRPDRMGEALSRFDFTSIRIPVLLIHHRDDRCLSSPYWVAKQLAKNFPLVSVSGGDAPQTGPCAPLSAHGFFGREAPVVQAMKDWMLGREFARDIR